ncbi:MAG: protein translocase subunit SecD, partial [Acidimicrobiales bacterium]
MSASTRRSTSRPGSRSGKPGKSGRPGGRLWTWLIGTIVVCIGAFGAVIALNWAPLLGLDLQGGISVVYKPAHPTSTAKLDQAIAIIRNRVDAFGVSQPNISLSGSNISVELPGIKDRNKALSIIGQTAQLRFRPVECVVAPFSPPKGKTAQTDRTLTKAPPACPSTTSSPNFSTIPSTARSALKPPARVLLPEKAGTTAKGVVTQRYVLGPSEANGTILKSATAGLSQQTGQWQVNFTLTGKGSSTFNSIATQNYQKRVAIALDGVVESAPVIQARNFHGRGQITGSFTQSQAKSLALVLSYGALPVQLVQQTVHSVSPTLGLAALKAGIVAAIVGLILVFAYTVLYYRALGIVVLVGLATTAAVLWAIISALGHTSGLTLDLAGITGLIVSVGVIADSYIVFFERLKDEVRAGKSVRSSVDRGFTAAFRTIIAADLVSLIGAAVLYFLSVAQVKNFAFYLGLSTLLDMITAWTFTRPFVILLGRNRTFTEARFIGVARGLAEPPPPVPPPPSSAPPRPRPVG